MYPALVSTTVLEIVAILVLLVVVPLFVVMVIAGAAEYVRQGVEAELAALEEAGAFEDDIGFEDESRSNDDPFGSGARHDENEDGE